jgi:hypothetical protein
MIRSITLTFLLIHILHLQAQDMQKTKIIQILDCDRFRMASGEVVRLAAVEAPSILGGDSSMVWLTDRIMQYAEDHLLQEVCYLKRAGSSKVDSASLPVQMYQKFMLSTVCINEEYLKNGFGRYWPDGDTTNQALYASAQEIARSRKRGVWDELSNNRTMKLGNMNQLKSTTIPGYLSISAGINSNDPNNTPYREVFLAYEPLGERNGFRIQAQTVFEGRQEGLIKHEGIRWLVLNPQISLNDGFIGFEGGMIWVLRNNTSDKFYSFSGRLKIGMIQRIFLSMDVWTDIFYSPFSLGINVWNADPFIKIWIGRSLADIYHGEDVASQSITAVKSILP